MIFFPIAIPLILLVPPLLVGDAVLEFGYGRYGGIVEVVWEDGAEMLRIAFDSAKLGGKEATRVLNQIVRKQMENDEGG